MPGPIGASHRFAHDVLAQDRAERGAAIAAAGERGGARALELDVPADAVLVDDLAEQDRAAIAELGNKLPELVAGVGHGDGVGSIRNRFAGQDCGADANMAKMLAADASWEAANACVQTHGGFGFAEEYDVERKFRETRLYQVAPISTNLILSFVAEHVLGMPRSY